MFYNYPEWQIKVQFISSCYTYLERAHEGLIHTHHGTSVVKLPTIVRRWEQSDELPLRKKFIAILNNLRVR